MSFLLIVWNMEIYMHDIVNVELLGHGSNSLRSGTSFRAVGRIVIGISCKTLIHVKKGLSSEKDWPSMLCLSFK